MPKQVNGQTYASEKFEGYKFRAKFEFETNNIYPAFIDIYTTETDKGNANKAMNELKRDKSMPHKIIHWVSKEADESLSKLIDEVITSL